MIELDPRPQDTPGAPPCDSLDIIYRGIKEKTSQLEKRTEQGPASFPDFKLLSAFDDESRVLRVAILESTKPHGEPLTSTADYKATELTFATA